METFCTPLLKWESQIKGIGFDQSYSPVIHAESFIINISIDALNRLTTSILDVSNELYNTNVPIRERDCVSPPPYYLDWFEKYYPNVALNIYEVPFFPQYMNKIQGGGTSRMKM